MYLDDIASVIRRHIPENRLPEGNVEELLRLYAVLLRVKGPDVTQSDVHDVWSAWVVARDATHEALIPYESLSGEVRVQDRLFANAIRSASIEVAQDGPSKPQFTEVLFPSGLPSEKGQDQPLFDLYKIMVESSEALVNRRQAVNTFFLTMNGALLTAFGIILQSADNFRLAALGIAVLASAGALLSGAWRSLIRSFGQLNTGKFKVINTIEQYLPAAIYAAEWEALGRGKNPKIYRSFTSREVWAPNSLIALHAIAAVVALLVAAGLLGVGTEILD